MMDFAQQHTRSIVLGGMIIMVEGIHKVGEEKITDVTAVEELVT